MDIPGSPKIPPGASSSSLLSGSEPEETLPPKGEYRNRLRKRENIHTDPESTSVKRRRVNKEPGSLIWHPVRQEGVRLFIDKYCLHDSDHLPDIDELHKSGVLAGHEPQVSTSSAGSTSGTGTFAQRSFDEGEIIGFYRGRLLKRTPLPEDRLKQYCQIEKLDRYSLAVTMMVVWGDDENDDAEFYHDTDSHVLWSGITVFDDEDTNIELGFDGLSNGNKLAYLNHIRPGNVKPIPTLTKQSCIPGKNNVRHINGKTLDANDLWIPLVATRKIAEGEELGFDYDEERKRIVFPRVGLNVFSLADRYVEVDGNAVIFREHPKTIQSDESFDSDNNSLNSDRPLFGDSLSDEEEALVEDLLEADHVASKMITERIRQNDENSERAVQLYLYAYGCRARGTPLQKYALKLKRCGFKLPGNKQGVSAVREYVRQNFHKTEAAEILNIAVLDPGELEKVRAPRTRSETMEQLDQIEEDTPEARRALRSYCQSTLYRSGRTKDVGAGKVYQAILSALHSRPRVLGRSGKSYRDEDIYKFMVSENIFRKGDEIIYLPMPYLKTLLTSDLPEDVTRGREMLEAYALKWCERGKQPSVLAPFLQTNGIPNTVEEGVPWTMPLVMKLPSLQEGQSSDSIKTLVAFWLDNKSGDSHFQMHQLFLKQGDKAMKAVAYVMREQRDAISFEEISTKLAPFITVTHDRLREAVYERGVELGKSDRDLKLVLGSWAQVFYQKLKKDFSSHAAPSKEDLIRFDSDIVDGEWSKLKKEITECREPTDKSYMHIWTEMMISCRTPRLEKIFIEETFQRTKSKKLVERLKRKKLPVFDGHSSQWTREIFLDLAVEHGILNIRNPEDQHIAVLIAALKPAGFMSDKKIEGKTFDSFLEDELLSKKVYGTILESRLKQNYPDNPYFSESQPPKKRKKRK